MEIDARYYDLLTAPVKSIDKWADFADAVDSVFQLNIDEPTQQIENLRFLLPQQGNEELYKTSRLLGFNLTQDVLELSTSNMSKLVTQLALYYDSNGTELFVKFIELVLNAQVEVVVLYTKDYVNFYTQPQGTLVINGGDWYKTTHIELAVALLSSYPILLYGITLVGKIKRLFYANSPINLVIERFWFVTEAPIDIGIGFVKGPIKDMHILEVGPPPLFTNLERRSWFETPTHIMTIGTI
jgi:hypothetical protein